MRLSKMKAGVVLAGGEGNGQSNMRRIASFGKIAFSGRQGESPQDA